MNNTDHSAADAFIAKWQGAVASELATSQTFLIDLCALLGVDTPHATADQANICCQHRHSLPLAQGDPC